MNYNQAKMLEKALSGFDLAAKDSKTKQDKSAKSKKSVLAPDPRPPPTQPDPASGIDVVILFDVNDELCLRRAAGRTRKCILIALKMAKIQQNFGHFECNRFKESCLLNLCLKAKDIKDNSAKL